MLLFFKRLYCTSICDTLHFYVLISLNSTNIFIWMIDLTHLMRLFINVNLLLCHYLASHLNLVLTITVFLACHLCKEIVRWNEAWWLSRRLCDSPFLTAGRHRWDLSFVDVFVVYHCDELVLGLIIIYSTLKLVERICCWFLRVVCVRVVECFVHHRR